MEAINKIHEAEEAAALVLIDFAKSDRATMTEEEVNAIETAMEIAGANTDPGRKERRTIILKVITPTDRWELQKAKRAIMEIAER